MTSRPHQEATDAAAPDETASIVRLYAVTDGRTRPRHILSLHTVLGPGRRTPRGLPEESARIVELCSQRRCPLAELAGSLGLPITTVKVLVSDLIDASALRIPAGDALSADGHVQKLMALSAAIKRRHPNAAAKAG
ncbi:DUF742 domain-containing protein [Streptomyces sp. V3I7]|uniref:DUF742 domain-containing protein n=1 Tax=Streptomyces sp. V3I7 TaxID=3042278 RepID=UPI0027812DD5|nr:DUF742 domain-containing protein [Streptomyces sp. V3I7]MDQ0990731.1 DNA-directed RNA polymerase specialized sigma24 family protein [Streptomyces sp. V3I7]